MRPSVEFVIKLIVGMEPADVSVALRALHVEIVGDEADLERPAAANRPGDLAIAPPPADWGSDQAVTGATGQAERHAVANSDRPTEVNMSSSDVSISSDGAPTYMGGGDPAGRFTDYYPAWLDNLADDVTVEGSMLDGAAQGPQAVRTIVVTIRTLYGDSQEFYFAGPCGENGWLEDYIAQVGGKPLGCVALVARNAAGQTQHIVASYRPRSSLLLFSRLLGEKFAGTPYAKYFLASES